MQSACKESQTTADELHLCHYRVEKFLNAGRSEKVMLCECNHHHFVVKAMKKDTTKSEWVTNETRAGKSLHHKGICKFKEFFQDQCYQYIVTEFIEGHDLWEFMEMRGWKPLAEKEARVIMKQLVKTVLYCHKHGVAHKVLYRISDFAHCMYPQSTKFHVSVVTLFSVTVQCDLESDADGKTSNDYVGYKIGERDTRSQASHKTYRFWVLRVQQSHIVQPI